MKLAIFLGSRGQEDSPLLKKVLTMKLKEMEEMAKQTRKTSTREGSLCASTATSFFTCVVCHPRGQYTQVTAGKVGTVHVPAISEMGGHW